MSQFTKKAIERALKRMRDKRWALMEIPKICQNVWDIRSRLDRAEGISAAIDILIEEMKGK